MTSPVTVTVVTAAGAGPSVVTAYADGSRSGSMPSTVATANGGATSLAGTTATTSRSARTSAGVPVRSAPAPAPRADQVLTAPSRSASTSATVRSSRGRVGCSATTSGVWVAGADGERADVLVGGLDDERDGSGLLLSAPVVHAAVTARLASTVPASLGP